MTTFLALPNFIKSALVGLDLAFGLGQYTPEMLTHVLQHQGQVGMARNTIQSAPCDNKVVVGSRPTAIPRLENYPSTHGRACACLVFVHNDETNARHATENLYQNCCYNLAIIQPGSGRNVAVPGQPQLCDPNELFPEEILTECSAYPDVCQRYVAGHNNLEATQKQFFLAVLECSDSFRLPTVALHNNTIADTEAIRALGRDHRLTALMGNLDRGKESDSRNQADLQPMLENMVGRGATHRLLGREGTNIFHWCDLPGITSCRIGNPWRPDHVIWTTNSQDYNKLIQYNVNVVLQARAAATSAPGGESATDLSTLFLRVGADARYINIETPITPTTQGTRRGDMIFILENLRRLDLLCCDRQSGPLHQNQSAWQTQKSGLGQRLHAPTSPN